MFSIFKHKVAIKKNGATEKKERLAINIVSTIIRYQEKWAKYLQRRTDRLSKAVKISALLAFCIISSGYCFYLLKYSFTRDSSSIMEANKFRESDKIYKTDQGTFQPYKKEATEEYRRLQAFVAYMDSLSRTVPGSKIRDSILIGHPGLLDSIKKSFHQN